jgi:hypothetical protein
MSEHEAAEHHDPAVSTLEGMHTGMSTFETLEGVYHMVRGAHAATHAGGPGLGGLGLGILGIPLGGISMAMGIDEVSKGEGSQGSLDILSGGLGMTSSVASIMGLASAGPLGLAAGIAGLAAYGNNDARAEGYYGKDREGENNTFLGSVRDKASDGWGVGMDAGHGLLGDNIAGDLAGGVMGGLLGGFGGIGQGVMNFGSAFGVGAGKAASNGVDLVGGALDKIGGPAMLGTGGLSPVTNPLLMGSMLGQ